MDVVVVAYSVGVLTGCCVSAILAMVLLVFKNRNRIDLFSLPCCGSEDSSHHFWVQKQGFRPIHRHSAPTAVVLEEGEESPMTGPAPPMSTFYRPQPISWSMDTDLVNTTGVAIASTSADADPPVSYATPISPPVRIKTSSAPSKRLPENADGTYIQMSSPAPSIQTRPLPIPPSPTNGVCYSTIRHAEDETPKYTNLTPVVLRVAKKGPLLSFQQQLEQHIQLRRQRCPAESEESPCGRSPEGASEPTEDEEKHVYEYVKTVSSDPFVYNSP